LEAGSKYKTTDFKLYDLEGRIWKAAGNLSQAERAYLVAWQAGSDEAEPALREIYQKKMGSLDGFREGLRKRVYAVLGKTPAKSFSAAALGGAKLDLGALKGKVVVLNFWFIGCGPCRAEMPGLNQLVKEFKGKDVVFIAFANDEENELREFLKTKAFDYQIVAGGFNVGMDYQVSVWPTHVIIDREGNVVSRLIGGSENRHKELGKLIERVLN
jgi:thiol-disulfide isomerase/thioredoxin